MIPIISSCCGLLLYLNVNRSDAALEEESNDFKNTLFPTLAHFGLCFIEHFIVIWIPTLGSEKSWIHIFVPFGLLLVAGIFQVIYYNYFHPVSPIEGNGPSFNIMIDSEEYYYYMKNLVCCKLRIQSYKKPRQAGNKHNGHVIEDTDDTELQPMNDQINITSNV